MECGYRVGSLGRQRRGPAAARAAGAALGLFLAVWALPARAQLAVRNQGYIPYSEQIEEARAQLVYEPEHGYLKSVLRLLNVPISSQSLVFSKTSFQYPKISPEHPRALYFNDDVYIGSVHEGKAVEIVSFDPTQGAIFYMLDERPVERPAFQRAELDCTQCHIAAGTRGVPGVLLRSVVPAASGTLVAGAPTFITDQESPLGERWGGWYVTGPLANAGSMANSAAEDRAAVPGQPGAGVTGSQTAQRLVALAPRFDAASYLAPGSDGVALLVLAHQTQMHNLITLTNYKTRLALYAQAQAQKASATAAASDAPASAAEASPPPLERQQFERPAEQLLRYLLFANEAPLDNKDGRQIRDSSAFAREFAARGVRDSKGRSLRDFDLSARIFRYPCSYLIYSDAFTNLPDPAKGYVLHRLFEVLSGADQSADFAKLSADDRRAVLEILLQTKADLPAEWRDYSRAHHLRTAAVIQPPKPHS
jgi:hypothetical protein